MIDRKAAAARRSAAHSAKSALFLQHTSMLV
jgi:hypothetical protein